MNAPKKILVPEAWCKDLIWERDPDTEIPYIRADIVDELVEALRGLEEWVGGTAYDKARAALAKLEESHD